MEDYKQKYDKAFGRAKALYAKGAPDSLHLEEIFPELQDSDDDRIRKALITHIKYNVSVISGWRKEELIAWLEKQGEMKPQGNSALEVWKDMRLEVYQQASGNRHEPNHSDDSTKMFSLTDIDEIFEKVAEKQGEQKPTWSEKDEGMCIFTIKILNDIHYKDNANWLKSLKQRMKGE